ncbi:MAG: chorismate mutase [Lentisphaerae bacterium]|jgi:chorismate mutase|nr:chorismate mutase [Lentisphaerota bacterium]MBT4822034.1 chorismate mutase [Lentisphaerota bacterium]MBT5609902.1 chorismate mutase [Lentisphaerota bacterium]MBT7061419.1 chorismate mutase [Lentisphaerota bacterium]MBT7847497.1 chorismate mutase [Lentisphaerota bacterium]
MNEQLLLGNIRGVLIRLEETIIFNLIERAQFQHNAKVYDPAEVAEATGGESLVGYLLHETERIHSRIRRYTSPDEEPYFTDLRAPFLPLLSFVENPIKPNDININPDIRKVYEGEIVPYICRPGDDGQYGSSAVSDTSCLQAISKRIHYGKFVAESKYLTHQDEFQAMIDARDADGLLEAITDRAVEKTVLERVRLKAQTYGQDIGGDTTQLKIEPKRVADVYARWIIPLTKKVEVQYLLRRPDDE